MLVYYKGLSRHEVVGCLSHKLGLWVLRIAKELKVILQYIHTSNMMDTIILQTTN